MGHSENLLFFVTVDLENGSKEYENVTRPTIFSNKEDHTQRLFIQESDGKTHIFNWNKILGYHYETMNEHNDH